MALVTRLTKWEGLDIVSAFGEQVLRDQVFGRRQYGGAIKLNGNGARDEGFELNGDARWLPDRVDT